MKSLGFGRIMGVGCRFKWQLYEAEYEGACVSSTVQDTQSHNRVKLHRNTQTSSVFRGPPICQADWLITGTWLIYGAPIGCFVEQ